MGDKPGCVFTSNRGQQEARLYVLCIQSPARVAAYVLCRYLCMGCLPTLLATDKSVCCDLVMQHWGNDAALHCSRSGLSHSACTFPLVVCV